MKIKKPLVAASLAASLALPALADPLPIDFEGVTGTGVVKNSVLIDSFYNGGFSTVLPGGPIINGPVAGSGVSFQDAIGVTSLGNGGLGNFFQAGLGSTLGSGATAMMFANAKVNPLFAADPTHQPQFIQNTAVLNAEFDGGFSFYFSSNSNLNVQAFDGTTALALTISTSAPTSNRLTSDIRAGFDAQAFANNCDTTGAGTTNIKSYCNWSLVNVSFASGATRATSIVFFNTNGTGGLEGDAGGFGTLIDGVRLNNVPVPVPVPEPSTFILMALGMLGIGIARRRQMN